MMGANEFSHKFQVFIKMVWKNWSRLQTTTTTKKNEIKRISGLHSKWFLLFNLALDAFHAAKHVTLSLNSANGHDRCFNYVHPAYEYWFGRLRAHSPAAIDNKIIPEF